MAGSAISGFLSLLERQAPGKVGSEQLVGLLSLYTLLAIVDYLQQSSGAVRALPAEPSAASEPALQKALAAVLGGSDHEAASGLANLARSLGKNPAALMGLVNLLAPERGPDRATGEKKGRA
ncbi:MAG: hypothetical protein QHH27_06825 [Clostridia bacterium]|nr:hypothetical protein [Clostridia bacterium]MDH7573242.1 hypothetical protein [Clostridia bacterium]